MIGDLSALDLFEKFLCIFQAVHHSNPDLVIPHLDGGFFDRPIHAAHTAVLNLAQQIVGFLSRNTADYRFGHAAGGAKDNRCSAAHAERQVGRILVKFAELDAHLLNHRGKPAGRQNVIDIRHSVAGEFRARRFKFFGRTGHDRNDNRLAGVGRGNLALRFLDDGAEHLLRGFTAREMRNVLGVGVLHIAHPRRAAGGKHREGSALFEPLEEFM